VRKSPYLSKGLFGEKKEGKLWLSFLSLGAVGWVSLITFHFTLFSHVIHQSMVPREDATKLPISNVS